MLVSSILCPYLAFRSAGVTAPFSSLVSEVTRRSGVGQGPTRSVCQARS